MALSNDELLAKAVFDTTAFGGAGEAPLAIEQVTSFIELMTAGQDMLPTVQTKTSAAPKWQESIIDFAGNRIAQPGIQGTRNSTRSAPGTGIVEMNTVLLRAEVPVVDEVLEDNVAGPALSGSLERLIADQFGYDIEEMLVNAVYNGTTPSTTLDLLDGWVKQAKNLGNVVAASSYGEDYQAVFKELILALPDRFKRNIENDGTFYVPKRLVYIYRDILASRETVGGDMYLTQSGDLQYQGIKITGVANLAIASGAPDTSNIILGHKSNFYAGFQRAMKFETFRDPREGAMSFVVTARVDAKIAVPSAVSIATSVNVAK